MILTDEVRSKHLPKVTPPSRDFSPLYCTAVGKAVLANISNYELRNYLSNTNIEPHTPNTITNHEELKKQLSQIAQAGVAFDNEEHWTNVKNIASAIINAEGQTIACVSLISSADRSTAERMQELAPHVKECAFEISQKLVYEERFKYSHVAGQKLIAGGS